MTFSRSEIIGAVFAALLVAAMGVIAFTGPYHIAVKAQSAANSPYKPLIIKMLTDPRTIGKFSPDPAFVHLGQTVTWVNDSNAAHTADATSNAFQSGNVAIGASYSWVPKKAGTYHYKCLYHVLMLGTLVVLRPGQSVASAKQSLPSPTATPTPQPTSTPSASTTFTATRGMTVNKPAKKVTIAIAAGATGDNNGFNFNGYSKGAATYTVPTGWTVTLKFSNKASIPHSVALATSHSASPTLAKINGKTVSSPNPTNGTTQGTTENIIFKSTSSGHYYLVCDVPGHAVAGMWDNFVVSSSAKTPSVKVK